LTPPPTVDHPPAPGETGSSFVRHIGEGLLKPTASANNNGLDVDPANGNLWVADNPQDTSFPAQWLVFNTSTGSLVSTVASHGTQDFNGFFRFNPVDAPLYSPDDTGAHDSSVRVYNPSTGLQVAVFNPSNIALSILGGVALNLAGTQLFLADRSNARMRRYTISTKAQIDTFTRTTLNAMRGAATDSLGNLYIANANEASPRNYYIHKYSPTQTFLKLWGSGSAGAGDGDFNQPDGIDVDASDRVFVSERLNHRVSVFTTEGDFLYKFGTFGSGAGQFKVPTGICVSGNDVFVWDNVNNRVSH
jgi:sugar lactone lactonase YvrE